MGRLVRRGGFGGVDFDEEEEEVVVVGSSSAVVVDFCSLEFERFGLDG